MWNLVWGHFIEHYIVILIINSPGSPGDNLQRFVWKSSAGDENTTLFDTQRKINQGAVIRGLQEYQRKKKLLSLEPADLREMSQKK